MRALKIEIERCHCERSEAISYKEDEMWIGWLEEYPDYRSQGESLPELKENLNDIWNELTSGNIPGVCKRGELVVN